jgi:hypothetical protein
MRPSHQLGLAVAVLGSIWALFREYLRYQQEQQVLYLNLFLAVAVPVALYVLIRGSRS